MSMFSNNRSMFMFNDHNIVPPCFCPTQGATASCRRPRLILPCPARNDAIFSGNFVSIFTIDHYSHYI